MFKYSAGTFGIYLEARHVPRALAAVVSRETSFLEFDRIPSLSLTNLDYEFPPPV